MTDKPLLTEKLQKMLNQLSVYYSIEMIKAENKLCYKYDEIAYYNEAKRLVKYKTLRKTLNLFRTLDWDEQIIFCVHSPYCDILIKYLTDEQKTAMVLFR